MTATITDLNPVTQPMADAVGYNPTTLTHSVYSEDFGLIGVQPYTVTASLTEYSSISSIASAQIEFVDPCSDPKSVSATPQTDPVDYLYTAKGAQVKVTSFVVDPPICLVTYKCV